PAALTRDAKAPHLDLAAFPHSFELADNALAQLDMVEGKLFCLPGGFTLDVRSFSDQCFLPRMST
ncbi:MAG: hypothetical protein OEM94_11365, partial [Acidimicrobiia bacterium]|nr:hypothetical protein [Acidimicrobiia bacterium]